MVEDGRTMRPSHLKTFDASTAEEWRAWLAAHHQSETDVWLVFHKRHTGRPSVAYDDAVDEALCFGWIDSLIRRLDDDRYARKFTPRKPDSNWSASNRKRYAQLQASGRLMPAGQRLAPIDRTDDRPPASALETLPADIEQALRKNRAAWEFYQTLAPSYRLMYLRWIVIAKREETRAKRLGEVIARLAAGEKPGLK
jgi:uncharacterized protein YdeI (YjbR/CyaY-like superfamily)